MAPGELLTGLALPLVRIFFFISLGLILASLIEELGWSRMMSRLALPFVRFGRFSETSGASFALAFISGVSANTTLAEAYRDGKIGRREVLLANLLNSLPRFFLHLPTVFFLMAPFIKGAALLYVGLTFCAALLRTLLIAATGRWLLPAPAARPVAPTGGGKPSLREALLKAWKRLRRRLLRIMLITAPIYALFFMAAAWGYFALFSAWVEENFSLLAFLPPEGIGIIVLVAATELTAGLAAAGALLDGHTMANREVVLALLTGTVLAAPIQALRHQLPYYAGIFPPRLAAELIVVSQLFRAGSVILVGTVYFFLSA
ncbi:membrane protein [Desulfurivibrio alkaliphilus]|uniref:Nucleoside recognition domain protein n=1 Tax=Desulfurivibrio alkaliphilus (strain DSM 19089 / UNIQEM U267 / AHT2) TaxID=589865 RepID=D6Z6Q8_DESAT|nr:membrane protein [Desulfurivibrio alkaliphilus]ADH85017.1 nucleoside recognition domain protein [Desulfurivibrio alkaliphilus AHT 2]